MMDKLYVKWNVLAFFQRTPVIKNNGPLEYKFFNYVYA